MLLVDDGVATGTTVRARLAALRELRPARIVVAVAVAPQSTYQELKAEADDSLWYEQFTQTTDEEVRNLLARALEQKEASAQRGPS